MYKDIICFLFFLFYCPKCTYGLIKREREWQRWLSCTHRIRGMNLRWNLFCLFSKQSRFYNIPDDHANSCGHTSSLLSIRCTWTRFLLACHPRNSTENTCVLFTLGTRCISRYFCFQWSTSAAAKTDVKGTFKSISNTNCLILVYTSTNRLRLSRKYFFLLGLKGSCQLKKNPVKKKKLKSYQWAEQHKE